MKLSRWILIAGLALVVWPGPSFGQTETVGRQPALQAPYGQDKAQTRVDQGNRGRPAMREPYGQQKDDRRLETGNRGRPATSNTTTAQPGTVTRGRAAEQKPEAAQAVAAKPEAKKDEQQKEEKKKEEKKEATNEKKEEKSDAKQEKKEEKEEGKDDDVKAHGPLPAPLTIRPGFSVSSSGWDVAVTPENLGGKRYIQLVKSLTWTFAPNARLAGFRVYEQAPGAAAFRLSQSVDFNAFGIGSKPYVSQQFTNAAGYTMMLVSYKLATGASFMWLSEWRVATSWPKGTSRHMVVAYDAKGREGHQSPVVAATNLGELEIVRPTEGMVLERMPAFQWSNIWPAELQSSTQFTYPGYGSTEVIVSEAGRGALWHVWLNRLTTSALYWFGYNWKGIRGGYELRPGRQYYFLVHTWGGDATTASIGYSRLTGFTVQ